MITQSIIDEYRPYNDSQINAAMCRIANNPFFPLLAGYVFPSTDQEVVKAKLQSIHTIDDFQHQVMDKAIWAIAEKTIDNLSCSGIEYLDPNKNYLFVSNHRDIMLDSALLQMLLVKNKLRTSQITFGSNLMQGELVIDIGKSNKMFKIKRGGSPREFYQNSLEVSQYMRYVIVQKGESVWIAQRNGRTKDGLDLTEAGLIRMLSMSGGHDLVENLCELNIVPISISYQWETCDDFKSRELFLSSNCKYIKAQGEDFNSIMSGIQSPKGNVHLSICQPIERQCLLPLSTLDKGDFMTAAASLIDQRINANYQLWDTNYIAYDLLHHDVRFEEKYTDQQRRNFITRMKEKLGAFADCAQEVEDLFLKIYANPIYNTKN